MPKSKRYTYELARDMVKAVVLEAKAGFGVCGRDAESRVGRCWGSFMHYGIEH